MICALSRFSIRFLWAILLIIGLQPDRPVRAQPAEAYALAEAVNLYRASVGLPRLAVSPALMVAAQRHVEWMAANYTYSHTGEGGSTPNSRAAAAGFSGSVGENAGGSTDASPAQMIFFWDQSSVHRLTMRMASATHIGAGFAANSEQRLFILLIGAAAGQSPPAADAPIAGGTPAIGWTPPPNMGWTANGVTHQGSDYAPAAVENAAANSAGSAAPEAVAYVMPFDLIRVAAPNADGSVIHTVEVGQTLWAIAARYGIEQSAIRALNYLDAQAVVRPGDRLIIQLGAGQTAPPRPTAPRTHTVLPGESLWTIAARYQRTVDEVRAWNDWTAQDVLLPGAVILIAPPPTATDPPMPTVTASPSGPNLIVMLPTGSVRPFTAAPPDTATPMAFRSQTPPTLVAPAPTPSLVEVTTSPPDAALRLVLIMGIIGGIGMVLWVAVTAALVRTTGRASSADTGYRSKRSGPPR